MNLAHWLVRTAALDRARPALFCGEEQVADYGAFSDQAGALAGWLRARGIEPGDRVAIYMRNTPEFLVALFGIWMAGGVAVPVNAKLHPQETAYIFRDAEIGLVFVSPALRGDIEAIYADAPLIDAPGDAFAEATLTEESQVSVAPRGTDDMAWLFYTSGTTGRPKGVVITHGMLMSMALSYAVDVDHVSAEDAALYAAPLSHGAGLYALMHVQAGARHVCPASAGFDPAEILQLARHFGSVHMFAAPTMVKRLTLTAKQAGARGTGLRTIVYAGGPMYNADIIEAVDWFGPVFVQIYGQGECPMGITALSRWDVADRRGAEWEERLGSVGRAQAAVEVQIGDEAGQPLPAGAQGEIMARGSTVMPGYWRNPAATEATLQNGWLRTGDIGRMDSAGYLTLMDRSKDVIITGGSNVYPREVEEVLLTHPDVVEVSVVGRPHEEWGEEVVAFFVGGAAEAALDDLCLHNIARFKRPKHYVRLEALPKNNYGKVLKTALRDML